MNLPFLTRISDPKLREAVRKLLIDLALLAEGRAQPIERSHSGKPESAAPAEAMPNRPSDLPPPKDRSLYAYYLWHFERAFSEWRFHMLVLLGRRDYDVHTKGLGDQRRAGHMHVASEGDTRNAAKFDREQGDRVVAEYVGVPDYEVAVLEAVSIAWVRTQREKRRRRPGDGRPKPGFLGLNDDERYHQVQRLKAKGMGQKRVAVKLGVSKQTVQRYWVQRPTRVAA